MGGGSGRRGARAANTLVSENSPRQAVWLFATARRRRCGEERWVVGGGWWVVGGGWWVVGGGWWWVVVVVGGGE